MKLVAIDSSGLVASVAILEDNTLVGEYTIQHKKTHSQTLLPMLQELCRMAELDTETVDAVAVAAGPGSFTGLRIGSATAKGLGQAWNIPIAAVPTLEALAYNLAGTKDAYICPIMDAKRNQIYTGLYYVAEDGRPKAIIEGCAIAIEELAARIDALEIGQADATDADVKRVVFLGDGVPVFREKLDAMLTTAHSYAPAHLSLQKASSVAMIGAFLVASGETETAAEHAPEYFRVSQAERERAERGEA